MTIRTPVATIGARVGLAQSPCWRRIQLMEKGEIIRRRTALLGTSSRGAALAVP